MLKNFAVLLGIIGLFFVSNVTAQSPVSDNFNTGIGSQWTYANIGPGPAEDSGPSEGEAKVVDGRLYIINNGWDVWGGVDGMGMLYQQVTGDFDVVVHVISFDGRLDGDPGAVNSTPPNGGNEWEKAGIAFRQGLDPGAINVSSQISRRHGLRAQYRLEFGGDTDRSRRGDDGSGPKAGWWARLVREGDTFTFLCAESAEGPWLEPDDNLDRGLPDNTLVIDDNDTENPPVLGIMYTPHSTDNNDVVVGRCILDNFMTFEELGSNASSWEIYK